MFLNFMRNPWVLCFKIGINNNYITLAVFLDTDDEFCCIMPSHLFDSYYLY